MEPHSLEFVPDHLKIQEIYNKTVLIGPHSLEFVSDRLDQGDVQQNKAHRAIHAEICSRSSQDSGDMQ